MLLWEIFTFGQRPYGEIDNRQFYQVIHGLIKSGRRLEKPDICPPELYDLLIKCWMENPSERPSFHCCYNKLLEVKELYAESEIAKQPITSVQNQSYFLGKFRSKKLVTLISIKLNPV